MPRPSRRTIAIAIAAVVGLVAATLAVVAFNGDGGDDVALDASATTDSVASSSTARSTTRADPTTTILTTTTGSLPPPTPFPPATIVATTPPPPPPPPAPAPCQAEEVSLTAATERPTYATGDLVRVIATLTNQSGAACSAPNHLPENDSCEPWVVLHHYFEGDDSEPQYNALLGPFMRTQCAPAEIVPAAGSVTVTLEAPFEISDPEDRGYFLRAGTWQVIVEWHGLGPQPATTTFECPEPGCRKGSHNDPPRE